MGLFGRKAKGRHALGAAVTSIPSRPPVLPALPVYEAPAPVADPVVQPVAPATTTAGAVAELLLTGEWAAVPGTAPVPQTPAAAPPSPAPVPAPAPRPAPVELVPAQLQEPAASRVQLGFRDGTSAHLDPQSSQYLALEELAQSLTRRD